MKRQLKRSVLGLVVFFLSSQIPLFAQEEVELEETKYKKPVTGLWLNTYGNIRLTNRLFWIAQTHFRFQETVDTRFAGQWAQVYNRHALNYLFSKKFNVSAGGVLRINFNTDAELANAKRTVPEWRLWHEYQFVMPFSRIMVYHRIRFEHRWSKGFLDESEYIYRNRYRYMLQLKVPINKPKLDPGTFYVSPEAELIMQSGKAVVDSPFEDLRLTTSFGYVINPRLTVASGMMYSQGQELSDGSIVKQKWTMRFHVYFSPDFRKVKNKIPAIHLND